MFVLLPDLANPCSLLRHAKLNHIPERLRIQKCVKRIITHFADEFVPADIEPLWFRPHVLDKRLEYLEEDAHAHRESQLHHLVLSLTWAGR